jgi:PAS domain S-box-containing protein
MHAQPTPQAYLETALASLSGDLDWRSALDALPVPIYTTDAEGAVTYWNHACVEFAGREPQLGTDKWCVTWQLFTTAGERLPHDQCPMAEALRHKRAIRDEVAIALRPDGTRRAFTPYPTPLFDEAGELTGAVNMLIDVSEEQCSALQEQAKRCRRLSRTSPDQWTGKVLRDMAEGFERSANALKKSKPRGDLVN